MLLVHVDHFQQPFVKCPRTEIQLTGLSVEGIKSDHHIAGALECSGRHPLICTVAFYYYIGLELLLES